jgi:N-acetylglutamate synthase-like GNAT family acetyltransferase
VATLEACADEPSLFRRSPDDVRARIGDFVVARDQDGRIVGCSALRPRPGHAAEILSVAVAPDVQGTGVGRALVQDCISRAGTAGVRDLWLGTAKPGYFVRFGFRPASNWDFFTVFGPWVLVEKLWWMVQQPSDRWLPVIFGRYAFMRRACEAGPRPSVTEVLGPVVLKLRPSLRLRFLALLERRAAERYAAWAAAADDPRLADDLRACARRETEIADLVEDLVPAPDDEADTFTELVPIVDEQSRRLFAAPLREQLATQAAGERAGAATWRAAAERRDAPALRETLLRCAALEEENAAFLEDLLARGARGSG